MITIYSTAICKYCKLAKMELRKRGIGFTERNIDTSDLARAEYREEFPEARTVPQILHETRGHIGGYEDLMKVIEELRD